MKRFLWGHAALATVLIALPAVANDGSDAPILGAPTTNTGEDRPHIFRGHDLTPPDERGGGGILYAPSQADNPAFRADLASICGTTVDYFDAIAGTPDAALLSNYSCVLTWVNSPYADPVAFGDNLAAYVDAGGTVILGQWTYPSDQGNYLQGQIMTPAYCPVTTTTSFDVGAYNGDGTTCVHTGVAAYDTQFLDAATLGGGNTSDGTFNNPSNSLAVAWRPDGRVYYSPGNTGDSYPGTAGLDWAELTCNMCTCQAAECGNTICEPGEQCVCLDDCPLDPEAGNCEDGIDNDCDGLTDCEDPDCQSVDPEIDCHDGIDNDYDCNVDCDDKDCEGVGVETCFNGIDDDCNGDTDCADVVCADLPECEAIPTVSEWGMIALTLLLLVVGGRMIVRRRQLT